MTNENVNNRIKKYINKIEPVNEGGRNNLVYNTGLQFRDNFGLQGDKLVEWLHVVNRTKCNPPLSDGDVVRTAQSVDGSKVPLGNPNDSYKPKQKQNSKTHARTEYCVAPSNESVNVADTLKKEVSLYKDWTTEKNIPFGKDTIGSLLAGFRTGENGKFTKIITEIRNMPCKDERDKRKVCLPAIVFNSEPQTQRKNTHCKHNGVMCIDFDDVGDVETAKTEIAKLPYVFACGISVSGKGVFALTAYEGTPDLKHLLGAIQKDIAHKIDTSRSDLCGLRIVSLDENLIVKDTVFPAVLTEKSSPQNEDLARISTGVDILDSILEKIKPIDWDEPSERDYILRTVERILETATENGTPVTNYQEKIYCYTGTHYREIADAELRNFLIEGTLCCGVPHDVAIYQFFVAKLTRQFFINAGRVNKVAEPNTAFINLQNGTLFFDKTGHRFEGHTPRYFIRYVLEFDYNPDATAPLWQQHLDRSLPHTDKQTYLSMCLALPFYKGKIEKAPILYGQRDTGKSTTLDVYKALLGAENISTETLAALTKTDYTGDYARARLDGKLVNIASDVSKKISDEGLTKTLISREAVSARHPHGKGFDMRDYARLVFAMNELPPQFFSDAALTKRAAIIEFDQQVAAHSKDTDFAEKMIANELPGVLNWIIDGLRLLIAAGRLDPPKCCVEAMERIRKENDPLSGWLEERQYYVGNSDSVEVKNAYPDFKEYCRENGNSEPSKKTFTKRLREAGYKIDRPNNWTGMLLYFSNSSQKNDAQPLENKGEIPGTFRAQSGHEKNDAPMMPGGDTVKTGTGHTGHNGHEKTGESIDAKKPRNPSSPQEIACKDCQHYSADTAKTRGVCDVGLSQQNRPDCRRWKPADTPPHSAATLF